MQNKEMKYKVDKEIYYQVIWAIRQYPSLLKERANLFWHSSVNDGMPRGTSISDPTSDTAARLERIDSFIVPIEKSLEKIPSEYHKGILGNIIERKPYPDYANPKTWKKWKRRLVYYIAKEKGLIYEDI